jgi:ADP-heptose:LPS heptosyltransferase
LLIEQIKDFYRDYEIALIGGESDKLWSESLSQKYELVDTCGELSILQTADLIDSCDAIITTDSAPLHIADALKVKGVALFGSTLVSKNGPYNGTIIPVRSPIECSPCQGTRRILECEDRSQCMSTIDPRIVFSVLRKLL